MIKKIVSLLMVFSLFCFTLFSTNIGANASQLDSENNNLNLIDNLQTEIDKDFLIVDNGTQIESDISTTALPVVLPLATYIGKKLIKEALKHYAKEAVIDAVMKELNLPKTISGKNLVSKLKKVGFEVVSHDGTSHVKMRGPNGKTFTVPQHKELATGTYNSIKKQIKDSIAD